MPALPMKWVVPEPAMISTGAELCMALAAAPTAFKRPGPLLMMTGAILPVRR